jgi:ABC-type branched-subunit amino acid transport system permease subunit/ABC-type branched-subunit amino acid transport system ATPase component
MSADIYYVQVCNDILLAFCLALGMAIIFGHAGILDLGYIAFAAVGAYTYALLTVLFGWSFWLCLPVSGALAAMFSVIIGLPTLRARGDYLAIVTLGFGEIVRTILQRTEQLTGGARGIVGVPHAVAFGATLESPQEYFWLMVGVSVLLTALYLASSTSRQERFWRVVRDNAQLAEVTGISRRSTLLIAFAWGAGIAGLTGVVMAARTGFLSPDSFTLFDSIYVLVYVVIVGQVFGEKQRRKLSDRVTYLPMLFATVSGFVILGELSRRVLQLKPTMLGITILGVMLIRHNMHRFRAKATTIETVISGAPPTSAKAADASVGVDARVLLQRGCKFFSRYVDRRLVVQMTAQIAGIDIVKGIQFEARASFPNLSSTRTSLRESFTNGGRCPIVGGIVGVIGLNGAGKTTLFRGLLNLAANYGSVTMEWVDTKNSRISTVPLLRPRRWFRGFHYRRSPYDMCRSGLFGVALQTPEVVQMTVGEYLITVLLAATKNYHQRELGAPRWAIRLGDLPVVGQVVGPAVRAHLIRRSGMAEIIHPYLKAFHLESFTDSWLPNLSLYHKRLVELIKILILRPHFILLDETMAGLDAAEKECVKETIRLLNRSCGIGVLVIEHDMETIHSLADSLILLDQGQIIAAGQTEEVLASGSFRAVYKGI